MIRKQSELYDVRRSPLFGIRSKRRLAVVLGWQDNSQSLNSFSKGKANYSKFVDRSKPSKPRDIESPRPALKRLQKRIESLLKRITLPDYLHSGRPGRSYLSNSLAHSGVPGATVTLDITSFYTSCLQNRIERIFIVHFGCAADVAAVLANLACCDGHLATGSPASPLLSFFAFKEVFDQIALRFGDESSAFTLYIDDISITSPCVSYSDARWITRLFKARGLTINDRKTRLFHAGEPKLITGRVLREGKSLAPNKQHLKMHEALTRLAGSPQDSRFRLSAMGRLRHVGLLDEGRRQDLRARALVLQRAKALG